MNDMINQLLQTLGMGGGGQQRPMQRRGRDSGMDAYGQSEAFVPGDPEINKFNNTAGGPPSPQQTGAAPPDPEMFAIQRQQEWEMDETGSESGFDMQTLEQAQQLYGNSLFEMDAETVMPMFMQQPTPEEAEFYNSLDPQGRMAIISDIVNSDGLGSISSFMDTTAAGAQGNVLQQMGEEDGIEQDRMNRQ